MSREIPIDAVALPGCGLSDKALVLPVLPERGLLRTIFDNTQEFISLLNPEGTVIAVNQTTLDATGLEMDAVVRKPLWETSWWAVSPETQHRLQAAIHQASRGEFVRYDAILRAKGATNVEIDFTLKPWRDSRSDIRFLIAEGKPYPARRASIRAGSDAVAQLIEAEKLLSRHRNRILTICSYCRRVRDSHDAWHQVSEATLAHAGVELSHTYCMDCFAQFFPAFSELE